MIYKKHILVSTTKENSFIDSFRSKWISFQQCTSDMLSLKLFFINHIFFTHP